MTHVRYMVASQRDINWGLTCCSIGTQKIDKDTPYPPIAQKTKYFISENSGRTLEEFQLLYITEGSGTLQTAHLKKTRIEAGDMFLIFPGEWHNYRPNKKTGWTEYWIAFNGSFPKQWIEYEIISTKNPILHAGVKEELIKLYNDAINTAIEQTAHYQKLLSGILLHILGVAFTSSARADHIETFDNVAKMVNEAKIRLYESIQENVQINMPKLAEDLGMSYSNFRYLFRRYTGMAPAQYLLDLKISRAKELLSMTGTPVKNISLKVGFNAQDYFTSMFKKKTGLSPGRYRELHSPHSMRG